MDEKEFKNFFESYAKNVDNANNQHFWKLSDEIIAEVIRKNIPQDLTPRNIILDAGGGTGRWICYLSKIYKSNFILYDLSSDMLKKAEVNIAQAQIGDRVRVVQGDMTNMADIKTSSIDHIVSIYSPISFIYNKETAANEMYRVLKKDGKLIIMGHGYFNAIYSKINNYLAPAEELDDLEKSHMVKWGEKVPRLNTFSKESMEKMLIDAGFEIITTYGIPVFIQPGPEDFDSKNKKISRVSTALQDPVFFRQIFDLEMKYNSLPTIINRGMNICSVGIKK
jgi:ubiquinone/menaquinone biosynthesis C-methylase UbiE